jgi:hypothetical protein
MNKRKPPIPSSVRVSFRVSKRLHALMRELFLRYRTARGMRIGGFYAEALASYVHEQVLPIRSEVVVREKVDMTAPGNIIHSFSAIRRLASHRQVPESRLIEEALERFLERDENYLDEEVYRRHKRRWEHHE